MNKSIRKFFFLKTAKAGELGRKPANSYLKVAIPKNNPFIPIFYRIIHKILFMQFLKL